MKTNGVPAIIMLAAGFIDCVIAILTHMSLWNFTRQLLLVLVLFYVIGCVVKMIIDRNFKDMEDDQNGEETEESKEEQEAESSEEQENTEQAKDAQEQSQEQPKVLLLIWKAYRSTIQAKMQVIKVFFRQKILS